ncbi:Fe-S cluster assembly protein dre2 [Rhizodiscina lignyota]|uniref:Fe-S cluster assembly protein dre2 n=1 Tax=Rhizodiscina lignyota TaxID=1504668 RepID=A0A9P4M8E4_9PEZI|nr:Fe-S cluster assembly protein dre2 [Rhizodiscina lignyota]
MAPFVMLDDTNDFEIPVSKASGNVPRTLLLTPPSVAAHPELLERVVEAHDRSSTDIQMLDRLAIGLASLPTSTYEVVLLLTDADGTRTESQKLLDRELMGRLVESLKNGGRFRSQDGQFGAVDGPEKTEAILAGLVGDGGDGMVKPDPGIAAVPLRLGKKGTNKNMAANGSVPLPLNGKRKNVEETPMPVQPAAGVGFVDFSDDLELVTGEDDELIDEDMLLTEEDMTRPIIQPPECRPKAGKRRRACKDCTCGLKEKIEAEDATKRANADKALNTIKLGADDLAEVDFTVQGKVGSCGNCALGDAFRCDGCPYIGLPAFKPGEEVRLLNNDVQL